ncbi:Thaumatin-like protein [Mycena indigotica]|uniref:Thaumatin-like protein n=1 Tax=Mycena indigotica TaxID=2126181 RepID=A0A8H6T626_9AGAR|nr:Thaumatin-like protein [Mycena indigotica]KAF7311723.1 Thaumatin-like protein [Mycena indigotica]
MYAAKSLLVVFALVASAVAEDRPRSWSNSRRQAGSHPFTFVNKCGAPVTPVITDTRCGYSPRCADAVPFSGPQPGQLGPGQSKTVTVNARWVGRVFASHPQCGPKGESCTMGEFNLDSGDFFTPQSYDISNIQGFTDSMQIAASGCDTVTCTNANCGCRNAYPIGDLSGCGNDSPVHACGAGGIAFTGELFMPVGLQS